MSSIYKTPAGRDALLGYYDRALASLERAGRRLGSRVVETRQGSTHLLIEGPEDAPPLVLVHGGHGSAVMMAAGSGALISEHRCYYVDVPGEPNRSAERAFEKARADDSIGRWMEDGLDALELERVAMLGVSGGGYMTLRCCATIPARLRRVVLITPEGLVSAGAWTQLTRVAWPLLRYRLAPGEASVRRSMAALCSEGTPIPDESVRHMALVFEHVRTMMNLGVHLEAEELRELTAPVMLLAAGRDVLFPGAAMIRRAEQLLPTLVETILAPEANHIHLDFYIGPAMQRVREFLEVAL